VQIKAGDNVPLVLQIYDGATDVYPIAKVFSPTAEELHSVELEHQGSGLYVASVPMPYLSHITVQYKTYEDPGHTQLSGAYTIAAEVFFRLTSQSTGQANSELFGEISDVSLEGTIIEQQRSL